MELADYLRRQFVYDAWANREVLNAIRSGGGDTQGAVRLIAHILSAEGLWLERLKGEAQSLPVWPELDLDQCEARATALGGLWMEYLKAISSSGLTSTGLAEKISYKNSKGEAWSNTVQDVLTHVVMHSAYHRGQIASLMRANGQTPAYTDFIHAVRAGCVE
jgi:uncharacterized damage-inducible protein DinB